MTRDRAEVGAGVADADLRGRTALVTGATDGIGRETALALGRLGATVHVHGRDRAKGEAVLEELAATDAGGAHLHLADFASLSAVTEFAATVTAAVGVDADADAPADGSEAVDANASTPDSGRGLDVLVNNAGGLFPDPRVTDDGIEYTFQVNHLAPFYLTNLLAPSLRAARGRVVTVSSAAHRGGTLEFTSLRTVDNYSAFGAYSRSKLANVLFTRELARRYEAGPAVCLHPGTVPGSGFFRNLDGPAGLAARAADLVPARLRELLTTSVVEGAETSVYLAAAPRSELEAGGYYVDGDLSKPAPAARDDRLARRLWSVSEDLCALDTARSIGEQ